jgi:hypothetical protein
MAPKLETIPDNLNTTELQSVLGKLPDMNIITGPWLAGGAARRILSGEDISKGDMDFFFSNYSQFTEFCFQLVGLGAEQVSKTSQAITYKVAIDSVIYKVQAINRKYYGSLVQLFEDFDFTVCQIATDGQFYWSGPETMNHITNKVLAISPTGTTNQTNAIRRTIKYTGYGFIPAEGTLLKIVSEALRHTSAWDVVQAENAYDWGDEGHGFEKSTDPFGILPMGAPAYTAPTALPISSTLNAILVKLRSTPSSHVGS